MDVSPKTQPSLDPARCPLCGEANLCAMRAGTDDCWCWNATIDPSALGRVPREALGVICLCEPCATGGRMTRR